MDLRIADHVAVVTGGRGGIGAQIVESLADEGARVAIWDRDPQPAQELAAKIVARGGRARAFSGDVTARSDVERVFSEILAAWSSVQVLVNNAGLSLDAALADMTDEQWDTVNQVCLKGSFMTCRAAANSMIDNRYGRIINIGSRAHVGEHHKANYAAAKAGLIGLTRSIALELAPHGVTANVVAPGLIRTERVMCSPSYPQIERRAKELTPIQRPGLPADVADAVLYLASSRTGFVSGEVLHVSGGRYQ